MEKKKHAIHLSFHVSRKVEQIIRKIECLENTAAGISQSLLSLPVANLCWVLWTLPAPFVQFWSELTISFMRNTDWGILHSVVPSSLRFPPSVSIHSDSPKLGLQFPQSSKTATLFFNKLGSVFSKASAQAWSLGVRIQVTLGGHHHGREAHHGGSETKWRNEGVCKSRMPHAVCQSPH